MILKKIYMYNGSHDTEGQGPSQNTHVWQNLNSWFIVTEQNNSKYEWNNEWQALEVIQNVKFRKYAFQWLHRLNYIVTWYVNPTTTFILFWPWVSTRNRFPTWFRKKHSPIIQDHAKDWSNVICSWRTDSV